jgi:hypothetical protein
MIVMQPLPPGILLGLLGLGCMLLALSRKGGRA